jgi:hypothetical protein
MQTQTETTARLLEIKNLTIRLLGLVETELSSLESVKPRKRGKPAAPPYKRRVERAIYDHWDKLRSEKDFTAFTAKRIAGGANWFSFASDSAFSAILSRWAAGGHLELVEPGSGRRPARYKIP